jgi:Uma2 family endonuclease
MRTNYDLYYNYSVDRQKDWEHRDVPEMRVVDEPAAPEPDVVLLEHDVDERHEEHEPSRP